MEYNKKLFWKIILVIVIGLFASTLFFFLFQIPRHYRTILPPQSMDTNIGVFLLLIGFALLLYYILNREEFLTFIMRREATIREVNSDPGKLREYQQLRQSIAMGLPAGQVTDRKELVRKGNLFLKLWVLCGIVVIFLSYFLLTGNSTWVYENRYWMLVGGAVTFALFLLIEDFYHENAANLYGWTPASDNEILYRHEVSPLIIVTGITVFSLLLLEWAVFQYLIPPYSQENFLIFNPQNPSLYFQFMPVVCCLALGIVYSLFRLKE